MKDKEKEQERNKLLNELGNNLTPAQTLYSSVEDLKKIKENQKFSSNIDQKLKNSTSVFELEKNNPYLKEKEDKIDNRILSDKALEKARSFIREKEGFDENAYQDTGGVWTIGYGHTKNVKAGDKITKEQANEYFKEDLKEHIDSLKHVKVKLSENEKAALSSLIYNIGGTKFYNSDLLKKLNAGDKEGAASEFDKWIYDNGKIQKGLLNRRKAEKELFLLQD